MASSFNHLCHTVPDTTRLLPRVTLPRRVHDKDERTNCPNGTRRHVNIAAQRQWQAAAVDSSGHGTISHPSRSHLHPSGPIFPELYALLHVLPTTLSISCHSLPPPLRLFPSSSYALTLLSAIIREPRSAPFLNCDLPVNVCAAR